jgi:twitching motility protein PilT
VLQGIISQRLVKTVDGGRRAAMEILVRTPTIEKLIMDNRDFEIKDAIENGREHYKSQSFDQALMELYNDGVISKENAMSNATSASDLELKMSGLNSNKVSTETKHEIEEVIPLEERDDIFGLK